MTHMRADARGYRARCVELAAGGAAPREIAEMAGLHVATVRRHLRAARDEICQLRAERLAALTGQALADASGALAALRAVLADPEAPVMARVRAAGLILDHTLRFWAASDVEARLRQLEELVNNERDTARIA